MYLLSMFTKTSLSTFSKETILKILENTLFKDIENERITLLEIENKKMNMIVSNENLLNILLSKIMELKIKVEKIEYKGYKIEVDRVNIEEYKTIEIGDKVEIRFEKEMLFKVGSNFKDKFSIYLMFDTLAKKYNKSNMCEKIFITDNIINKIVVEEKIKDTTTDIKGYKAPAFTGSVRVDLRELAQEKSDIKKLLTFGLLNGVGFNSDKGYGKIILENI